MRRGKRDIQIQGKFRSNQPKKGEAKKKSKNTKKKNSSGHVGEHKQRQRPEAKRFDGSKSFITD
jgi:hypothetical protein